jgi:hypothetical protein
MAYALLLATGLHFFFAVGLASSLASFGFFDGGFLSDLAMCLLAKGWHF